MIMNMYMWYSLIKSSCKIKVFTNFLIDVEQDQKPLVWGEPETSNKKSILTPWKKMNSMVRTTSNLSSTSSKRGYKPTSRRSTPSTPTKYERKCSLVLILYLILIYNLQSYDWKSLSILNKKKISFILWAINIKTSRFLKRNLLYHCRF